MRKTKDWNHVSHEATADAGLSTRELLYFHAFNPNGVRAAAKVQEAEIEYAVKIGCMKTGAYWAYGNLDTYHQRMMMRLLGKKRVTRGEVLSWINGYRWRIDQAYKVLCERCN